MRPFTRLIWKEARELLRPRYVLPILMLPVLFIAMGQGFGGVADQLNDRPEVGLVNYDGQAGDAGEAGEYGAVVTETVQDRAAVVFDTTDVRPQVALNRTTDAGGSAVVVVPENFTERIRDGQRGRIRLYTQVRSVSVVGIASSAQVEDLVSAASHNVTVAITGATETQLDPIERQHTTYVKGERMDASPGTISAAFTSQFILVPVVIMFAIVFSGQMVMNSMASEKENKTLETLLSMPVKRRQIVAAKLLGGSVVGLVATAFYTGGLAFTQVSFGAGVGGAAISLSGVDYVLIGLSLFFSLVGTLALALALGVFADSQQGAQMLLLPLSGLAILPMFATMFTDLDTLGPGLKAALLAIPFTHPIVAPKRLLFDDVEVVLLGIGYEVLFAVGAVWLVIRLFDSDRPITGDAGWLDRLIELVQR